MNAKEIIAIVLLFSSLICISIAQKHTNEVKKIYAQHLCGATFIEAWQAICKFKANSVTKRRRSKRSIHELVKPRTRDFLHQNGALQFLSVSRKRRQVILGGTDNADEECCKESCTYAEVAEYAC